ncbi:hypothetical protein QM335_29465, partial [Pseudomonas aeruginosa]|nr:hypothetical protein [Pseudomonas aeruginosa]
VFPQLPLYQRQRRLVAIRIAHVVGGPGDDLRTQQVVDKRITLLRPEVIARTSNYVGYPNGNQAALPLVERKLRENPAVYLSKETMATLFPLETLPLKVERIRTRVWSRVKTGS